MITESAVDAGGAIVGAVDLFPGLNSPFRADNCSAAF